VQVATLWQINWLWCKFTTPWRKHTEIKYTCSSTAAVRKSKAYAAVDTVRQANSPIGSLAAEVMSTAEVREPPTLMLSAVLLQIEMCSRKDRCAHDASS
jgi:hypothetical protein